MEYQIALMVWYFLWTVLFYDDYIYENNIRIGRFSFLNKGRFQREALVALQLE